MNIRYNLSRRIRKDNALSSVQEAFSLLHLGSLGGIAEGGFEPDLLVEHDAGLNALAPVLLWMRVDGVAAVLVISREGRKVHALGRALELQVQVTVLGSECTIGSIGADIKLLSGIISQPAIDVVGDFFVLLGAVVVTVPDALDVGTCNIVSADGSEKSS